MTIFQDDVVPKSILKAIVPRYSIENIRRYRDTRNPDCDCYPMHNTTCHAVFPHKIITFENRISRHIMLLNKAGCITDEINASWVPYHLGKTPLFLDVDFSKIACHFPDRHLQRAPHGLEIRAIPQNNPLKQLDDCPILSARLRKNECARFFDSHGTV